MSSADAADHRGRKRRRDDAQGGRASLTRRRLSYPPPAVRSFGLRLTLAASPRRLCRGRGHGHGISSVRLRSGLPLGGFRVAVAPAPRRRRRGRGGRRRSSKGRVDGVPSLVSTPHRGRSRSVLCPTVRHFPGLGLRPFVLRFLLAAGAPAPRRRRKPAVVDMGNYFSRLFGKRSSNRGSKLHREPIEGPGEVVDLTGEPEHEAKKIDAVLRGIDDLSAPASNISASPEKRASCYKEELEWTSGSHERLEGTGFEVRLQELKLADLPGVLAYRPKEKEVINLYIELLKERAEREPGRFLKCHFFNTFFYKKLTCGIAGYDYQSVRRWTSFKKLGYGLIECEKIFVPIHRDIHWCLAVINMKDRTFQYLDSLGGMGHDVLRILAQYIMDELKDKANIEIDTSSWVEVSDSLPLQQNGWDCGMFMLKFIDFHSRGLKPSFRQEHMEYFRKRTVKEIIRLKAD